MLIEPEVGTTNETPKKTSTQSVTDTITSVLKQFDKTPPTKPKPKETTEQPSQDTSKAIYITSKGETKLVKLANLLAKDQPALIPSTVFEADDMPIQHSEVAVSEDEVNASWTADNAERTDDNDRCSDDNSRSTDDEADYAEVNAECTDDSAGCTDDNSDYFPQPVVEVNEGAHSSSLPEHSKEKRASTSTEPATQTQSRVSGPSRVKKCSCVSGLLLALMLD